jgi:hypothetical protein
MKRTMFVVAACVALAFANMARAQHFVVNSAGPHDSVGPWFTAGNALLFPSYSGGLYLSDKITISGTLTQVHQDSYASDSTWWLKAFTGSGTAFSFIPQITFAAQYTSMNLTHNTYGGFWIKNYPQYRFEAVEMGVGNGDQAGIDAQWTNMTFEFHPFVPVVTTGWTTGTVAVFDTLGSSFSTRMGLYSLEGELLDQQVGGTGGADSLDASSLAPGAYYLIVGASDGDFQDLAAMPGTAGGDLKVNFNGAPVFDGALGNGQVTILNLQVVPEPAGWMLASGAAVCWGAFARRRR